MKDYAFISRMEDMRHKLEIYQPGLWRKMFHSILKLQLENRGGDSTVLIPIEAIQIKPDRREVDPDHVRALARSIEALGLLNPITLDKEHTLIAGLHRLEAAKLLCWTEIECTVCSLEGLQAELAEIDENFVRKNLSAIDFGDTLMRRKEIYEILHPTTKNGGDRKSEEIRKTKCRSDFVKSFVQDTAEKLGVAPRTIARQIRTAKNLTPEAKKVIKDTPVSKLTAHKLSCLNPEQQKEAAELLVTKEIKSVDEYTAAKNPPPAPKEEESKPPAPIIPFVLPSKHFATFKESIADLKDPNKDCSCTPDIFLAEFSSFVNKFIREIDWYHTAHYEVVFPYLTEEQLEYLQQITASVCVAAKEIVQKIEGKMKYELQEKPLSPNTQKG